MPGPYSSFMVFRRRASLVFLLTSNKAYRTRRDAARAVGTRDFTRSREHVHVRNELHAHALRGALFRFLQLKVRT